MVWESGSQDSELITKDVRSGILYIQQKIQTEGGPMGDPVLSELQESSGLQQRHHIMFCMNDAAMSLLLRLKQAVLFEDSETRHVATVALCMVRETLSIHV